MMMREPDLGKAFRALFAAARLADVKIWGLRQHGQLFALIVGRPGPEFYNAGAIAYDLKRRAQGMTCLDLVPNPDDLIDVSQRSVADFWGTLPANYAAGR